jgi:hypothetical protein
MERAGAESFSRLLSGDASRVTGYEFGLARDPGLLGADNHALDLLRTRLVAVDRAARRSWTLDEPRWQAHGGSERWSYYLNARARPVAWLVHRVRTMPDDEALRVVRGEGGPFDPATEALASEPMTVGASIRPVPVRVVEYDEDEITLHASAPAAALLVTSELAYPGWTAQVDGTDARLRTVNAGFRAVEVPAGEHDVGLPLPTDDGPGGAAARGARPRHRRGVSRYRGDGSWTASRRRGPTMLRADDRGAPSRPASDDSRHRRRCASA